jgi:hypothetical protein
MQNIERFEQQRLVSVIGDSTLSEEEKQERFYKIFKKMTEYTVKNVSNTIVQIVTPDGEHVSDPEFIEEYVTNSERQLFDSVKKKLDQINAGIPDKTVEHTCDECGHKYQSPFTFDQANFFVFAS